MNYINIEPVIAITVRNNEENHYYRVQDDNFEVWIYVENHSEHNTPEEVLTYCIKKMDPSNKEYMVEKFEEDKYIYFDGKGCDFAGKKLSSTGKIVDVYKKATFVQNGVTQTIDLIGPTELYCTSIK